MDYQAVMKAWNGSLDRLVEAGKKAAIPVAAATALSACATNLSPTPQSLPNGGAGIPGAPTVLYDAQNSEESSVYTDSKGYLRWSVDDSIFEPPPSVCRAAFNQNSNQLGNVLTGAALGAVLGEVFGNNNGRYYRRNNDAAIGALGGAAAGYIVDRVSNMNQREARQFWERQCIQAQRELGGSFSSSAGGYSAQGSNYGSLNWNQNDLNYYLRTAPRGVPIDVCHVQGDGYTLVAGPKYVATANGKPFGEWNYLARNRQVRNCTPAN